MKKTFLAFLLFFFSVGLSFSQLEQNISWKFSTNKIGDNKVEVICEASLVNGWHVYSTDLPENTAFPTSITIEDSESYLAQEGVIEVQKAEVHFDESFGADLKWFTKKATFKKIVELKQKGKIKINGYVEYMICNDETCMPPDMTEFELTVESAAAKKSESYWGVFWMAFFAGFAALLTPCVFPMIPMTVSFFTKQSKTKAAGIKNAVLYGISIIVIYIILGVAVSGIFGANALNALSTNPWFNIFFFVLLVIFAISFFGAFEIILPSSWVNMADRKSDKGGIIGIFFMAFTLALVSFSCTGPIVGALLVQAAGEGGMAPVIGMLGFSSALALPFAFFAAFPGYLNSLPKSGGWLNSVKVVLGFLELAFAFKFLSIADMVLDLHLLEREVFIAIWIAISGGLGFYLLGKIRLPHDSPMDHTPVSRFVLGLLVLAFTIYMIPGLWGAPVNLISGFPPPKDYSESPYGVGNTAAVLAGGNNSHINNNDLPEGMHPGPQNIPAFEDYEQALVYAKKVNKPLLLDFTGKGCTNCRKMEDKVWSNETVKGMLANDYVLVSLYVDLRTKLPEEEVFISPKTGKKIRTIGNKWADFQLTRFNQQGQPYYVLIDTEENTLNQPKAYDPDVDGYIDWLNEGIEKFKNK